jgi:hypothetical protein
MGHDCALGIALSAALGITAYWPIEVLYIPLCCPRLPGFTFSNLTAYTLVLVPLVIYGLWGLAFLYRNRDQWR